MSDVQTIQGRAIRWRLAGVVAVTAAVVVLILLHVTPMNGWLWKQTWCRRDPLVVFPVLLLAAAPAFLAVIQDARRRWPVGVTLAGLTVAAFLLEFLTCGLHDAPFGFERIRACIEDWHITSYYLDAQDLHGRPDLLEDYPGLIDGLRTHSMNKPPGQVLYFMLFIDVLGAGPTAAYASGVVLGILALAAVPATFLLARTLGAGRDAAVGAAALMALCPGFLLNYPQFDQLYASLTCLLVVLWVRALQRDSVPAAAGFGASLTATLLFSHLLLVLGALPAALSALHVVSGAGRLGRLRRLGRQVAVAAGTLALLHVVLWMLTGYDPVAMFKAVLASKFNWDGEVPRHQLLGRPHLKALVSDPWEFALGTGWVCGLIAIYALVSGVRTRGRLYWAQVCCLGQIALVPALGLVRGESARLWIFLIPLLVFPAGVELARWPRVARLTALLCLWLVLAAVFQNMKFLVR